MVRMTRSKLSKSDKQDIAQGFRTGQSVQALADHYGVSSSTVRRILKEGIAFGDREATDLQESAISTTQASSVAQTELPTSEEPTPTATANADRSASDLIAAAETEQFAEALDPSPTSKKAPVRRSRRRASVTTATPDPEVPVRAESSPEAITDAPTPDISVDPGLTSTGLPKPVLQRNVNSQAQLQELQEELEDTLDDDLDDDLDDLDDDLDDEDFDGEDDADLYDTPALASIDLINILPLSAASFPRPCYLVIDRSAELITRPLKDFADLGQIPSDEVQETTLPVFDNHRMARRFSNRTQRIVKVPDGNLLQKVGTHLYARGITRLLLNGKVYAMNN